MPYTIRDAGSCDMRLCSTGFSACSFSNWLFFIRNTLFSGCSAECNKQTECVLKPCRRAHTRKALAVLGGSSQKAHFVIPGFQDLSCCRKTNADRALRSRCVFIKSRPVGCCGFRQFSTKRLRVFRLRAGKVVLTGRIDLERRALRCFRPGAFPEQTDDSVGK